jgi:tRNA dimethylallyltransferase
LYLRALCDGLFDGPAASPILRARLKEEAREHGIAALHRRLAEVDAPSAARIGPADYVRIERALEVYELTGRPLSAFFAEHERERQRGPRHHTLRIGLDPGPMDLRARIAARVEHMLQAGLLQEVAAVRALGPISDPPIGYDLCCRHLDGELTRAEFCEQLEQKTWQYARRQLTWFRKEPGVTFYPDADAVPVDEIVECIKRGGTAPAARSRKAG